MPTGEILDFIVRLMPFVTGMVVPIGIVGLILHNTRIKEVQTARDEAIEEMRDQLNALKDSIDRRFSDLALILDTEDERRRLSDVSEDAPK